MSQQYHHSSCHLQTFKNRSYIYRDKPVPTTKSNFSTYFKQSSLMALFFLSASFDGYQCSEVRQRLQPSVLLYLHHSCPLSLTPNSCLSLTHLLSSSLIDHSLFSSISVSFTEAQWLLPLYPLWAVTYDWWYGGEWERQIVRWKMRRNTVITTENNELPALHYIAVSLENVWHLFRRSRLTQLLWQIE